jgi:hypothetical protein
MAYNDEYYGKGYHIMLIYWPTKRQNGVREKSLARIIGHKNGSLNKPNFIRPDRFVKVRQKESCSKMK